MGKLSPEQQKSRGPASPRALAVYRAAWGCDCDGKSHRIAHHVPGGPATQVESHAGIIEQVTGHRPPSCPWRSFYSPLVKRVLKLSAEADGNYVMATLGPDPAAILTDALTIFRVARSAGERRVQRWLKAKRERPTPRPPATSSPGFVSHRRRQRRRG